MKKILQNLKLIDNLTLTLPVTRSTFVDLLSAAVEPGDITPFSGDIANMFDKRDWFGKVDINGFNIRKKKRMFEQRNQAIVSGSFADSHRKLTIEAEINGFSPMLIIIPLISICGLVFIASKFPQAGGDKNPFGLGLLGLIVFGLMIVAGPFMAMRRSVTRMKYEVEKEFVYLANANKDKNFV